MNTTATHATPASPWGRRRLLRVPEAARHANVAPSTLYRAIHAGRLPAVKVGLHSYRLDPAEYERWLYGPEDAA